MISEFHYCLLNERLEEDFWKRPEVWRTHDAHIPRKRPHFKNSLKISMCSSALHSRSHFPFLPKSSHPHGNFPNTRSFYDFFVFTVFSVMTNSHRTQIISCIWQAQWTREAWALKGKRHPLSTFFWGLLFGLPKSQPSGLWLCQAPESLLAWVCLGS